MDATSVDIFPQAIIDKIKTLQAKVYQKGMISVMFYIHVAMMTNKHGH